MTVQDGKLIVNIDSSVITDENGQIADKNDVMLIVAFRDDYGILKKADFMELTDELTAEYDLQGLDYSSATVYVWDKGYKPYTDKTEINFT